MQYVESRAGSWNAAAEGILKKLKVGGIWGLNRFRNLGLYVFGIKAFLCVMVHEERILKL